jgi:hypothetical protein
MGEERLFQSNQLARRDFVLASDATSWRVDALRLPGVFVCLSEVTTHILTVTLDTKIVYNKIIPMCWLN